MTFKAEKTRALIAMIALVFGLSSSAETIPEPTMRQIYEAATAGHLDQAQVMITQVMANHPKSAKDHWVQRLVNVLPTGI